MCHAFYCDSNFYQQLLNIDQQLADYVRQGGCRCGGLLHSARYPRKPRGASKAILSERYSYRFSFCCSRDGCRRRCTPPSVRFLGRKVYLGAIVVLMTALEHGLTPSRRARLMDSLDLCPQTLHRLRRWWTTGFADSRCWRSIYPKVLPAIASDALPGALLGRLSGADLPARLIQLLLLIQPITSVSCSRSIPVAVDPQRM